MSVARFGALLVLLVAALPPVAKAQSLSFDSKLSDAEFRVHLRMPLRASGHFTGVRGELLGSRAAGWRVLVQVDGHSLSFDGPAWMERITRSEDFLAVDRYPDIRFSSKPFTNTMLQTGGDLHGELILRGRKGAVTFKLLPAGCPRPGVDCAIQVRGTVSRHAFGMTSYRLTVKDEVDFNFRVRLLPEHKP